MCRPPKHEAVFAFRLRHTECAYYYALFRGANGHARKVTGNPAGKPLDCLVLRALKSYVTDMPCLLIRAVCLVCFVAQCAVAAPPQFSSQSLPVRELRVRPSQIILGGTNRQQQLRIIAKSNDREWDATHYADINVADPAVVRLQDSRLIAVADGRSQLEVHLGSATLNVSVAVRGIDRFPALHFGNDIMPLFSKLGCNSGGCHGKQSGQNGFKLSVFGHDPQADFSALVHEGRGRRLFPAVPGRSLLVQKAAGTVPHGGGVRCSENSPDFVLLTEWVRQGAPRGQPNAAQLIGLEIEPDELVTRTSSDHQALVTAVYSDGSQRDVTGATDYAGNADLVASVDANGRIRTGTVPGEAAITVNYRGLVGTVRLIVPKPSSQQFPQPPANNRIDELVWAKLEKMGLPPSALCDDATFLRRLYVGVTGTLPSVRRVHEFLEDGTPEKRRTEIERILQRSEYADYWALQWADVLLVDRDQLGDRGAYQFHSWLRDQLASNRPYDEWVRELILATGNSGRYGPVNFFRALRSPEELTRSVSQAFLGIRMDCAQCHHHPFEKWSQEDFYGLAGFFNGLQRVAVQGDRELIYHQGQQAARLPLTKREIAIRPPDGPALESTVDGDPRRFLANWLTSKENPWFSRVVANRVWKQLLGRGLVEPEDDLRTTNPAVNEPLLDYLADQLESCDFDLKQLIRLIVNSRVYQLSSQANDRNYDDHQNFSHHQITRLQAEVFLDAICQVTEAPESFPGMPDGVRSIQLWDNRMPSYFLDTFGRSPRESPCQCAKSSDPTMAQALHLMNAPEIEAKIKHAGGRVARLVEAGHSNAEIVDELCVAALGRRAGPKESAAAERLFANSPTRRTAIEDFLWTLLNSYDFIFLH